MACILTALTTGSLNASVSVNLLQSNLQHIRANDQDWNLTNLEAETSGSLEASINPILIASTTGSLQASTTFNLNATWCDFMPGGVT